MRWIMEGLARILAGEPWSERRAKERRTAAERRHEEDTVTPQADRRQTDRRQEERRGKGWLRFWNPP